MRWTEILSAKTNEKRRLRFAAAALAMTALSTLSAWAQCPVAGVIEVLPLARPLTGNTCLLQNTVSNYGLGCRISGVAYSNPEAIYKVWLHTGNQVEFNLTVKSGDLALALLQQCGIGTSCIRSADGIKSPNENLPKQSYAPGFYYLYIDAASVAGFGFGFGCGQYELAVSGVNPVPDLVVGLTSSPKPVVAGDTLTYTLSVENRPGALAASNVTLTQTLPVEVSVAAVAGCTVSGGPAQQKKVVCTNIDLTRARFERRISARVAASTPTNFVLSSTATATAQEGGQTLGDQNPADNQRTDNTTVRQR